MIARLSQTKDWGKIDPQALLELVGVRRMSSEFGFLFRHYWMPASTLTYRRSTSYRFDEKRTEAVEEIVKRPGKCTADTFCWRETILLTEYPSDKPEGEAGEGVMDGFVRTVLGNKQREKLCLYDRSNQTFRTRSITGESFGPESEEEARTEAVFNIPILTPLLPIPLGFQWHVETSTGHMEFQLESEATVGNMPVLIVRRRGRFSHGAMGVIRREGVTAYAWQRSTVLEDRVRDRGDVCDWEVCHVTKLVKSVYKPQAE